MLLASIVQAAAVPSVKIYTKESLYAREYDP